MNLDIQMQLALDFSSVRRWIVAIYVMSSCEGGSSFPSGVTKTTLLDPSVPPQILCWPQISTLSSHHTPCRLTNKNALIKVKCEKRNAQANPPSAWVAWSREPTNCTHHITQIWKISRLRLGKVLTHSIWEICNTPTVGHPLTEI